jgi:hypothetical protein
MHARPGSKGARARRRVLCAPRVSVGVSGRCAVHTPHLGRGHPIEFRVVDSEENLRHRARSGHAGELRASRGALRFGRHGTAGRGSLTSPALSIPEACALPFGSRLWMTTPSLPSAKTAPATRAAQSLAPGPQPELPGGEGPERKRALRRAAGSATRASHPRLPLRRSCQRRCPHGTLAAVPLCAWAPASAFQPSRLAPAWPAAVQQVRGKKRK